VSRTRWGRDAAVVARAVLPRPGLWITALAAVRRMARRGWWHRAPFVPVPGEAYWRFRLETAYGSGRDVDGVDQRDDGGPADEALTTDDVVAFLRWSQRSRPGRG
jgi:hypothetical protein